MKELIVPQKYKNKKLIDFLLDNINGIRESTIHKLLRKKDIKINDKRVNQNCNLQAGDNIKVYISDDLLQNKINIPIVYEDENIIIFNKPAGIEVTGNNSVSTYAKNLLKNTTNQFIKPCHRLDRNTCGLVLFARSELNLNILLDAFKNHLIEKHYIGVTYGIPKKAENKLEGYLFKDSKKSFVYVYDNFKPGTQKIVTSYKILKSNPAKNIALLDITIETGRTHQIRAHLAHIGYPILGDGKYGINKINKSFKLQNQQLCSYSLKCNLPKSNKLSYLNNITFKLNQIPFINLL